MRGMPKVFLKKVEKEKKSKIKSHLVQGYCFSSKFFMKYFMCNFHCLFIDACKRFFGRINWGLKGPTLFVIIVVLVFMAFLFSCCFVDCKYY